MSKFKSKIVFLALLCALLATVPAPVANAQTATTVTTISSAMTAAQTTITLASGTGISVQGNVNQINTGIYVDREFMWITTLVSGTTYNVARAKQVTQRVAHASGATVYAGPLTSGPFFFGSNSNGEATGACTSTAENYLPRIYTATGHIYDCRSNGYWISLGTAGATGGTRVAGFCTGTVGTAETEFLVGAACSGATTSTTRHIVSRGGTLADLRVFSSANVVGGTGKDVLTVQKNGTDTTITCTIAASAATCSDTTHAVAVAAGDVITFKFVTATSDTAANVAAAVGVY